MIREREVVGAVCSPHSIPMAVGTFHPSTAQHLHENIHHFQEHTLGSPLLPPTRRNPLLCYHTLDTCRYKSFYQLNMNFFLLENTDSTHTFRPWKPQGCKEGEYSHIRDSPELLLLKQHRSCLIDGLQWEVLLNPTPGVKIRISRRWERPWYHAADTELSFHPMDLPGRDFQKSLPCSTMTHRAFPRAPHQPQIPGPSIHLLQVYKY